MTLFIGILLFLSFAMYSRDVTSLVVRPIESMIDVVRKLAEMRPRDAPGMRQRCARDVTIHLGYSRRL